MTTAPTSGAGELPDSRKLSTPRIVFLVVAAAAPLAAMVGNVPLALKLGNGPGLPGAFAIATLVLLCFAVGYAAMSRKVVNTGAFYTYVARGLGRPPAVSAALVAVVSYNALAAGLLGAFGYFGAIVLDGVGVHGVPWYLVSVVGWVVVTVLGYRSVDVSARVLAVLMSAEIAILLVLDVAVLHAKGASGLPATVFAPSTVFSGALGLALMFAFASFIGFESAALYGEESRDPQRSIPRATYASVLLIGTFYTFTTWCIVGGGGVQEAQSRNKDDLGTLVLDLNGKYAGAWAHDLMAVFFVTSVLASMLAIHNAASRYMFALGRERLLPTALGRLHPMRSSPSVASITQSVFNAVVVTAFALAGLDPYLSLAASMVGLSTLGIVLLQAAAAVSIVAFFWRRHEIDVWRTLVAPLVGAAGLLLAAALLTHNYGTLTGTTSPWVNDLPLLLVVVAAGGVGLAMWMRRNRPATYAGLAQTRLREQPDPDADVPSSGVQAGG